MGLQKGQSGYVFRWLMPIFAIIGSLMVLGNAIIISAVSSADIAGFSVTDMIEYIADVADVDSVKTVITMLNVYTATIWIFAIMLLAVAVLGLAMNKKVSYILGTVFGAIVSIFYLIETVIVIIGYDAVKEEGLLFFYGDVIKQTFGLIIAFYGIIFIATFCVFLFGVLAIGKCKYPEVAEAGANVNMVGDFNGGYDNGGYNGGYDNGGYNGGYDNGGYNGGYDNGGYNGGQFGGGYNPPVASGTITGVNGMYSNAKFPINDNEELVIGRDPGACQIVIGENAQNVSRMHCSITYNAADNSYRINDISKNGTFTLDTKARFPHGVYSSVPAGTVIYLGDKKNSFRLG